MDIKKLFGVLVVGGALLAAGCDDEEPQAPGPDSAPGVAVDRLDDGGTSELADADPGEQADAEPGEELIDCGFCPNEVCCESDGEGGSSVKAGFECCWSTTC